MQTRLKKLLDEKNMTATKFANIINVNASAISHMLSGRSKPGFDILEKIARSFPDINITWLITGKETMYKNTPMDKYSDANQTELFVSELPYINPEPENKSSVQVVEATPIEVENKTTLKNETILANIKEEKNTESITAEQPIHKQMVEPVIDTNSTKQNIISEVLSSITKSKIKRIILFFEDGSFEDYHS